jgi:hypothetical protein
MRINLVYSRALPLLIPPAPEPLAAEAVRQGGKRLILVAVEPEVSQVNGSNQHMELPVQVGLDQYKRRPGEARTREDRKGSKSKASGCKRRRTGLGWDEEGRGGLPYSARSARSIRFRLSSTLRTTYCSYQQLLPFSQLFSVASCGSTIICDSLWPVCADQESGLSLPPTPSSHYSALASSWASNAELGGAACERVRR